MATFSDAAWDGSASRWPTAEAYCESCLIDANDGEGPKVKSLCHLPIKEPDGTYSVNGIHAAAAALAGGRGGVDAPPAAKRAAARKLKRLYAEMKEDCPPSIARMAM